MSEIISRDILFAKNLRVDSFNHFIISLITYDRICIDHYTFMTQILPKIPRKYHQLLLDIPELEVYAYYLDKSFIESELRMYFTREHFDYTNYHFDTFSRDLIDKIKTYSRVTDTNLLQKLIQNNDKSDFMEIHDAHRVLKCNYYNTSKSDLFMLETVDELQLNYDFGQTAKIFEINRLPDLTECFETGDFNLPKFLDLRNKTGINVVRELVFKEKNFENTDELIREYNEMLLKAGVHKSILEKPLWAISNALSVFGVFSPNIAISLVITLASLATGNFKIALKDEPEKLKMFINHNLRPLLEE